MKFGYNWPSSFRGEVVLNCGRTTTTDDGRRTTEPSHPIRSPRALGSGELKYGTVILLEEKKCNL